MAKRLSINQWASDERPREKFLEKGAGALSNAELLAILIGSGTKEYNAIELGRAILSDCNNNLSTLSTYSYDDFKKFKGVGPGKALSIMAIFELSKRMVLQGASKKIGIYSSENAAKLIMPILEHLNHEECWILFLDVAHNLIAKEKVSSGGVSASIMDVRLILKKAMNKLCSKIILVHNHPSGTARPGECDKQVTRKLKEAALLCDIFLIDHLIIAGNQYFSFADNGLL